MTENEAIILAARKARDTNRTAVLATVVAVSGSSYRLPGARMLVTEDGWQAGSISGGCLEADIARRGTWLTRDGRTAILTYDTTDDDDFIHGPGPGCRGIIQVLLEPLTGRHAPDPIAFLEERLIASRPGVMATVISADTVTIMPGTRLLMKDDGSTESDSLPADIRAALHKAARAALARGRSELSVLETDIGEIRVCVECIKPPPPLLICGAGHDAIPLAALAKAAGFHVTVADSRPSHARRERFPAADCVLCCSEKDLGTHTRLSPETLALVMTHRFQADLALLRILLHSPVGYIGLLGPKKRAQELSAELAGEGETFPSHLLSRLYAPVGLDIGAVNAEEVALSIVAELVAVRNNRSGGHLKNRESPIHTRTAPPRVHERARISRNSAFDSVAARDFMAGNV